MAELSALLADEPLLGELLAQCSGQDVEDPLEEPEPEEPAALAGVCAAGFGLRSEARGTGFASGGTADRVPPGPALAGLAQDAWDAGLERLNDDQLIGVMLAWRRLASRAEAGQLAAVAELDRRRHAQVAAGADAHLAEHVTDEVAAVLTLTAVGADRLVELAVRLTHLPGTRAALAAGLIDQRKATVIADETSALGEVTAAAAEHLILPDAARQTTGQLRVAAKRAVAFMDPDALVKRREEAAKEARVEVWSEPSGTAALAGRDLRSASVLAASTHLTALARQLKDSGAAGTIDQLRAHAYIALLLGQSPAGLLASAQSSAPGEATAAQPAQADDRPSAGSVSPAGASACVPDAPSGSPAPVPAAIPAGLGGSVNLTMPLATLLGSSHEPGEVPGYGLVPAEDCRALATAMTTTTAAAPASTTTPAVTSASTVTPASTTAPASIARATGKARWCLTLTGDDGQAVAHGCATGTIAAPAASGDNGWSLTFTIRPLATADCAHRRESAGYRPAPSLQHLITIRQRTCSFPGCRRPATRCDLDHTLAYEAGGRTCECNLAPLCRRHHQAKQAQGWHLEQPQPGTLTWTMPHGRNYVVSPGPYP